MYVKYETVGLIVSLFSLLIAFAVLFKQRGGMKFGKEDYQNWCLDPVEEDYNTQLLLWVCSEFLMCVVSQSKFDKNMEMKTNIWKWAKGSDICFMLAVLTRYYDDWKRRAEVESNGDKWTAKTKKEAMKVEETRKTYSAFFTRYNAIMFLREVPGTKPKKLEFTEYYKNFGGLFREYWIQKQKKTDDADGSVSVAARNAKKKVPEREDQIFIDWGEMGMTVQI